MRGTRSQNSSTDTKRKRRGEQEAITSAGNIKRKQRRGNKKSEKQQGIQREKE